MIKLPKPKKNEKTEKRIVDFCIRMGWGWYREVISKQIKQY